MKAVFFLFVTMVLGLAFWTVTWAQKPATDPMERAIADLQAGNTEKAIAAVTEAIKLHPDYVDAYLLRANLRATSGDSAGALADMTRVIELKPDMGSAYYERSVLRLAANDILGAIKDLDASIIHSYKIEPVYVLRGHLREQQNDLKGALADLNEAIKLNPDNPRAYNSRAHLLLALEDKDRALADLDHLLSWYETGPTKRKLPPLADQNEESIAPPVTPAIASKESKTKDPMFKIEVAVKTVNQSPTDKEMVPIIADAYYNRGLIQRHRNNAEAAIADFSKSIRVSPSNVWAFFYRASELEGRGDLAGALADIDNAIELEPLNGNLRLERGAILLQQGNSKEAQGVFDVLLKSDSVLWQKRIDDRIAAIRKQVPNLPN